MRWIVWRGVAGSALMLAGGLAFAVMPPHTWADTNDPLLDLRHLHHHIALGVALAVTGLVLQTWSWWSLRGRLSGRPDGVRLARLITAAWAAPLLIAPPLFSGDGWSYVATGYLTGHGLSPYVVTPSVLTGALKSGVNHEWLHTATPYGPLPLVWGGAFSRFTADPWLLLASYRLLAVVGLVMLAWAVPRIARRVGKDPAEASVLVLASPLVIAHGIGGMHNDLVMAGLMLVALAVTRRDRWLLGAALAGAAAAVKVPGGLVVVGVVLLSLDPGAQMLDRFRRTVAVGVVAITTLLLSGILTGLGVGWVHGLLVPIDSHSHLSFTVHAGRLVVHVLNAFGAAGVAIAHQVHPVLLAKELAVGVLVAIVVWMLVRRRIDSDASAVAAAASVMLAATLLSPVLHYWYLLWCLPLLGCVRLSRAGQAAFMAAGIALGLTAIADPAIHLRTLPFYCDYVVTLLPPLAWGVVWLRQRRSAGRPPGTPPGTPPAVPAAGPPTAPPAAPPTAPRAAPPVGPTERVPST